MSNPTWEIQDDISYNDFYEALRHNEIEILSIDYRSSKILCNNCTIICAEQYLDKIKQDNMIYGKNKIPYITNISYKDDTIHVFRELPDGKIDTITSKFHPYTLGPTPSHNSIRLGNNTHYRWLREFVDHDDFMTEGKRAIYLNKLFHIYNQVEAYMCRFGHTYFKEMTPGQVSLLSFDIETSGINPRKDNAKVFLITNTFRKNGCYLQKTFSIADWNNQWDMIEAWCTWVREEINPSLIIGHNIYIFDLYYLNHVMSKQEKGLALGRDGSNLTFERNPREKRKDGSQSYTYYRPSIFGRDLLDTFFLSITYDVKREFSSYALKPLIRELGFEEQGRVFIDPGKISEDWDDLDKRKLIIQYAEADSRDPIKLYDKFASSFFYFTQHIPKPFQLMTESATGSQINSFLVRAYLQNNESIPKATESNDERVEGGISFAIPGIYDNVVKVDIRSCYPSQILRFKLYDKEKDPYAYYYEMVKYFTHKRFEYKKLKGTDPKYKDLDDSSKIFINSSYGLTNTKGLNFNNNTIAKKITGESRAVIDMSLRWASGHDKDYWINQFHDLTDKKEGIDLSIPVVLPTPVQHDFQIVNCDTDSISLSNKNGDEFTDIPNLIKELNGFSPEEILWEDDGYYAKVLCLKAKNYVLVNKHDGKITYKGSAFKTQTKEPAMQEMMHKLVKVLLDHKLDYPKLTKVYHEYIKEAMKPSDIKRWASKKTVTKPVLEAGESPETARTNELKVWEALEGRHVQEGDKVYLYPAILGQEIEYKTMKNGQIKEKMVQIRGLRHVDDWKGDEENIKLVERVYKTLEIFAYVVDMDKFVDYTLVKNKNLLIQRINQ